MTGWLRAVGKEMWDYYVTNLNNRNQALAVLAGLVLSGALWWWLLKDRPRVRRWLSWAAVLVYFTLYLVVVLEAA